MMKCPQCGEPHDLSDCPRWKAPAGHRLLPVALAPHIKDALTRWTDFQASAWADVMQAQANIDASAEASSSAAPGDIPPLFELWWCARDVHISITDYSEPGIVPINRDSAMIRALGKAIDAAQAMCALAAPAPTGESLSVPEWESNLPLCPTERQIIEAMEEEIKAHRAAKESA